MRNPRRVAAAAATSLMLALAVHVPAQAAAEVSLTVHYTDSTAHPAGEVEAQLLDGTVPTASEVSSDAYGEVSTFVFAGADDGAVGFRVSGDSAFPADLRYVRSSEGSAEVWVVDGDPRVYDAPITVDPASVRIQDRKAYIPVSALVESLDLQTASGTNGYVFDGHARGTIDILTLYYGRDYHEIAVDLNRIGSNVTGNMLSSHTSIPMVFDDVDGFKDGEDYYLSFAAIERILQVGTLVHPEGHLLLPQQEGAHDAVAVADPESVGFDPTRLEALDDFAQQQIDAGYAAIAVSVVKDGKVVLDDAWGWAQKYATGVADDGSITPAQLLPVAERTPASSDTLFDLASNTKMYATNYAIQRLVSEGRLDLDQRLVTFPGWEGFTDANSDYTGKWTVGGSGGIPAVYTGKETVTIRDILHHVGGMIPDPEYPNLTSAGDLWYQTDDPDDRTGIIDAISRTPLRYPPRTTFAYSDVDYMILGLIVEQITGQRLDEYLQDEFYGPLGLEDTTYRPLDAGVDPERIAATELNGNTRDGNVSFGTLPDGTDVPIRQYTLRGEVHDEKAYYSMAGIAGHAGLFSTTGDMAVLTQLMLNGGVYGGREYFTQDVAQEFVAPFALNPTQTNLNNSTIGLGWRIHSKTAAAYYYFNWGPSRSTFGHQGWTGTLTIIDPVHQMTVTILTSRIHSPVVSPPNGFESARLAAADLVPMSGLVYRALDGDSVDYQVVSSVGEVDPVLVPLGTSEAGALAALPTTVAVTDTDSTVHEVGVAWEIESYDGAVAGSYTATGALDAPAWLVADDGDGPLTVTTTLTVQPAGWDASTVYVAGDRVVHDGREFEAQWWTRNEVPGASPWSAWAEIGALVSCPDPVHAWTASGIYTDGDEVARDGRVWRAMWWTRNQVPGDPSGPWQRVGTCTG